MNPSPPEVYAHEQKVSGMINPLVDLAIKEKDHATLEMLQWFVKEQVEEEKNSSGILEQIKIVGDGTLWCERGFCRINRIHKDISDDLGQELLRQAALPASDIQSLATAPTKSGMFDKVLGKAKSSHKEGLRLSFREGKYVVVISWFDRAIEADPTMAYEWHDRGVCLRELGMDEEALRNFDKAVELLPSEEELLFSRAEMLRRIGILRGQKNAIEAAVKAYNTVLAINPNHVES